VRKSGRRVYVSPACRGLLGWEPEEMLDIPTAGALHPDDVASLTEQWLGGFESDEAMVLTYRMRRKDASYVWVESISRALPVVPGERPERILVVRDIDRRVAAEQKLKDSEARYRLLAEFATDIVFQLDRDLVRRYVSPACREILGYEPEELVGVKAAGAAHPDDAEALLGVLRSLISGEQDRASMSCRMRHRNGHWLWVDAEFRLLRDSQRAMPTGILVSLRDVSKRKEAEDRLEEDNRKLASEAARDGLTGLLNRRSFDEALKREFRRSKRESKPLGLVMLDIDKFKSFNDLYGHPAGDACLRAVRPRSPDCCSAPAIARRAMAARNSPSCCLTPTKRARSKSPSASAWRCRI
jgi:PAS domain S-box-containing protein